MKRTDIVDHIFEKCSFLCVGLDPDINKLPACIEGTPGERVLAFCRNIVDATAPYCVAYKPNTAFFESLGAEGWQALADIAAYIKDKYPRHFLIADAKRGDIGNTAALYARTFFETMPFDAVTLNPYMGENSVAPFLAYADRWSIVLALTSNASATDFETVADSKGVALYERVIRRSRHWGSPVNTMYVVGATQAERLAGIRRLAPRHFLLIPGVGAQGGSLEEVAHAAIIDECGILVNSSRGIIYASTEADYAEAAAEAAAVLRDQMAILLQQYAAQ